MMKKQYLLFLMCLIASLSRSQSNSLNFDGVNDYVEGVSSPLFELTTGTIELWVKPKMKATSQTMICYRSSNGALTRYLWNLTANLSSVGFWNGSTYQTIPYQFTPDQWYHLAFVDDNVNTKLYVNATYIGAFPSQFGSASGSSVKLHFGVDIPYAEYFLGEIDEARIWSIPFCQAQVTQHMTCGIANDATGLIANYKFNVGVPSGSNASQTTLPDNTSNQLNGTLINFALNGNSSNWVASSINYPACGPAALCGNFTDIQIVKDCWPYNYPSTLSYLETWSPTLTVDGISPSGNTPIPPTSVSWLITDTTYATISATGKLKAKAAGTTFLIATAGTLVDTVTLTITAPVLPPVVGVIDPYLAQPNSNNYQVEMPVIIIRYLPTADGVNLDVSHAPDFWSLGNITLAAMQTNLDNFDKRIKFSVENGTRFRDYGQNTVNPYLGFSVVQYITVYEPTPRGKIAYTDGNGYPVYEIDYHAIFNRFNIQDYVENDGVKEVWVWAYGHDSMVPSYDPAIHQPCDFRFFWESNMSSPTTGDVSNSNQDVTDLPVYDHTYLVYNQNIRRTQAEAVHNRGHQVERMFTYAETGNTGGLGTSPIFWQSFVGHTPAGVPITGRCGWTHMPPNTTNHYDYTNPAVVLSDIKDWKYDNSGVKLPTSQDTWANINYVWPGSQTFGQKTESQFYIFWMQSFPGFNNNIPYPGNNVMTNWWKIYSDWDFAILNDMGLYEAICVLPTINGTTVTQPTCTVPTGTISISASGSGTLLYSINNGATWQTSNTFSGLAPATYPIKVKMQGNATCITTGTPVTVNPAPVPPTVNMPTVTQPTCATPSGTIVVNANGNGTLEYSINNGSSWQASATFLNLNSGNYNIRVRLQASPTCWTAYSGNPVIINAVPSPPTVSAPTVTHPTCVTSSGTILVNASGGGTLEYSINNGSSYQVSATFSGLAPGSYIVKVRLQANPTCTTAYSGNPVIINAVPSPPTVSVPTVTQPTCATPSGTILVNASGGGTLEYSINNGSSYQASATFSGLSPGSYNVKVRLQANPTCTTAYSGNPVVINAVPSPPTVTAPTVTHPTCVTSSGTILVNASGGGALEYSINNGSSYQTSASFFGLSPGNYTVKVRLQSNPTCTTAYSGNPVVINAIPSPPTVTAPVVTQPTCTTPSGTILVNASGGGTLEYSINNGSSYQASASFSGLAPGSYIVKVRLQSNPTCTTSYSGNPVVINAIPNPPTVTAPAVIQPTCATPTGTILVNASGGGTLEYSINNGSSYQASATFSGLAPGNYTVKVRLQANPACTTEYSGNPVIINAIPSPPTVIAPTVTQPTCATPSGTILVNASGGGALEYSINNGSSYQASATFSGLAPGSYTVKVRLQSNPTCTTAYSGNPVVIETVPSDPVVGTPTLTQPNCDVPLGAIEINASGGGAMEYSINDGISYQASPVFPGLLPGNYNIKVRLVANPTCETTYSGNPVAIIAVPDILVVNLIPIPNGPYEAKIELTSNGTVDANGNVVFRAGTSVELQPNFEVLPGGVFEIIMQGCN